jgi:outer membrane protein OmpA-like peptidoglycan-associated protein
VSVLIFNTKYFAASCNPVVKGKERPIFLEYGLQSPITCGLRSAYTNFTFTLKGVTMKTFISSGIIFFTSLLVAHQTKSVPIQLETNSYKLTPNTQAYLNDLAGSLRVNPTMSVAPSLYCDGIRADRDTVTHKRSDAVYAYLRAQGIPDSQLKWNGDCSATRVSEATTVERRDVAVGRIDSNRKLDYVRFEVDKADLDAEARRNLEAAAARLRADRDLAINTVAHCDSSGTRDHNVSLGERRADAVADYLKSHGVRDSQIRTENECAAGGDHRTAEIHLVDHGRAE